MYTHLHTYIHIYIYMCIYIYIYIYVYIYIYIYLSIHYFANFVLDDYFHLSFMFQRFMLFPINLYAFPILFVYVLPSERALRAT